MEWKSAGLESLEMLTYELSNGDSIVIFKNEKRNTWYLESRLLEKRVILNTSDKEKAQKEAIRVVKQYLKGLSESL